MTKYLSTSALDRKYLAIRSSYQTAPLSADFSKLVVNKPWGNEYLMYSNEQMEIWSLFIHHNHATSMHCHPNKKTALLVLDGTAQFSSLNESLKLSALDTVIIEPGAFHSTQGLSPQGIRVLEFETPPMKHDLVRLEDKYGRTDRGYENTDQMFAPGNGHYPRLTEATSQVENFCRSALALCKVDNGTDWEQIMDGSGLEGIAVVVSGQVTSANGDCLYQAGDILWPSPATNNSDLNFSNLKILTIRRNQSESEIANI